MVATTRPRKKRRMPKRIAVEMKCERCPAVWYEDYTPGDPEPETASVEIVLKTPVGEGVFAEKSVKYEVLCKKCAGTVTNYVDGVELDPDARKKPKAKKEEGGAQGDAPRRPPESKSTTPRPASGAARRSSASAERAHASSPPSRANQSGNQSDTP